MPDRSPLALDFAERRPRSAAAVLADLPPEDAAAFLTSAPLRIAAPLLARIAPWSAARSVECMKPETAADLFAAMPYQDAASLIRLVEESFRQSMMAQLPRTIARDFQRSMQYPRGTVGAWMDHSMVTFEATDTVGDVLRYSRQHKAPLESHITVVDPGGRYGGVVALGEVLRIPQKTPLLQLVDKTTSPISNRATLSSVLAADDWDGRSILPVVGRRNVVVGGLTRQSLRKGIAEDRATERQVAARSIFAQVFAVYLLVCRELLRLMTRPVMPDAGNNVQEKSGAR